MLREFTSWACRLAGRMLHADNIPFFKYLFCCPREGNGNPLQYCCLKNPMDRGACWAAVHGVAESQTRLKRLSMYACIGEGNGNPLQYSCLENPTDRGAWWAAVCGVAQRRTRLKQLSSSSSSSSSILFNRDTIWSWPLWPGRKYIKKAMSRVTLGKFSPKHGWLIFLNLFFFKPAAEPSIWG